MNLFSEVKNPFVLFIGCVSIGILTMLIMISLIVFFAGGSMTNLNVILGSRDMIIKVQVIQMITLFVLPPVLMAVASNIPFNKLYHLDTPFRPKKYLLALLLVIFLFPFVMFLHDIFINLPLPDSIKTIAETQRLDSERLLKLFLDSSSFVNFLLMLLIVGLGAGFTEELFFRGAFMMILIQVSNSRWLGIYISGVVFAVFHFSIYDFVPLALVGILFGYIYSHTFDLKLNIFIHSMFNGMQVIMNYLYQIGWTQIDLDDNISFPFYIGIPCLFVVLFITRQITKKSLFNLN